MQNGWDSLFPNVSNCNLRLTSSLGHLQLGGGGDLLRLVALDHRCLLCAAGTHGSGARDLPATPPADGTRSDHMNSRRCQPSSTQLNYPEAALGVKMLHCSIVPITGGCTIVPSGTIRCRRLI